VREIHGPTPDEGSCEWISFPDPPGVRVRGPVAGRDLSDQVFDNDYRPQDVDPGERAARLKWRFELADGRRVTTMDTSPYTEQPCARSIATTGYGRYRRPADCAWFAINSQQH